MNTVKIHTVNPTITFGAIRDGRHNKQDNKLEQINEKSQQVAAQTGFGSCKINTGELTSKASCLSEDSDILFKTSIKNIIFFLNGFVATLKRENMDYQLDKNRNLSETKKTHYKEIYEKDHKHYMDTASRIDSLKAIIQTRISALEEATLKAQFETALLTEACIGNTSNFTTSFLLPSDYKYGIPYRLSEARSALEARYHANLSISEDDLKSATVEHPKSKSETASNDLSNLNVLLGQTVALKEISTIYSAAFKKSWQFADLKKFVYFSHLNLLKEYQQTFEHQKASLKKRLEVLQTLIERESLNKESTLLPSFKFEKLAIQDSMSRMKCRLQEIFKFLETYKVDESEKPEESKLEILNDEYEQAVNLLKQIVGFKEELVRDNAAEIELSAEQRKDEYVKAFKKLEKMTQAAAEVKESYERKVKELKNQSDSYLLSVEKLKNGISQVHEALEKTAKVSRERLSWNLESEVKQEVIKSTQQEGSGFLNYLWTWGSTQEVSKEIQKNEK